MGWLESLAGRRLIVVMGKGGVGKSAVAAVLGRRLAAAGRRVLVLEFDPRESVHQMLGVAPSGGDIVPVAERLHLQNLRPRQVVDRLVRERVRIPLVARRVLASPIYDQFVTGAPGLEETAVLGHCLRLAEGELPDAPELDLVVLDAPATGHGLSLLAAPGLVAESIGRGPVAELTRRVAALVADRQRCGVVVVSLAEEMPVSEALELRAGLAERLDREPELLVVNQLWPPAGDSPRGAARDPLEELARRRRRLNERELARLAAGWDGPRIELPLVPEPSGPELIAALAAAADGPVGAGA